MTENKRFFAYNDYHGVEIYQGSRDTGKYIATISSETEADRVCNLINQYKKENEELKSKLVRTKIVLDSLQNNYARLLKIVHGGMKND